MSGHPTASKGYDAPIEELDRVRLTRAVTSDAGLTLKAGLAGTVVSIYGRGEAFYVEFTGADPALATVGPDDIEAIPEESRARLAAANPVRR